VALIIAEMMSTHFLQVYLAEIAVFCQWWLQKSENVRSQEKAQEKILSLVVFMK
jgi:hypothetical protein